MTDYNLKDDFQDCNLNDGSMNESLAADNDLVMEQILDNLNTTPIGQVLKKIASLPDCSQQKILGLRSEITTGNYDLNNRLDQALDRVLEDIIT